MTGRTLYALSVALAAVAAALNAQTAAPAAPAAKKSSAPAKAAAAPAAMTNQDVIRLVKAKLADDAIIAKIKQSKTKFDTSVDGLIALKQAGVSDNLIAVMMNPAAPAGEPAKPAAPPPPAAAAPPAPLPPPAPAVRPGFGASNASAPVAATGTSVAARKGAPPRPAEVSAAPQNYGVYIWSGGKLNPLG